MCKCRTRVAFARSKECMYPINKHFGGLFGFVRDIAQGRMGASKKNMVDCFIMMSQHKGADSVGRLAQQKELWGREPARDVSQLCG